MIGFLGVWSLIFWIFWIFLAEGAFELRAVSEDFLCSSWPHLEII